MLDYCIEHKTCDHYLVGKAAATLAEFYRNSPPVRMDIKKYQHRMAQEIMDIEKDLLEPDYELPADLIIQTVAQQLKFLYKNSDLMDQRISANRIIEAHGDLRPEHICLTAPPVFMDCLEFSKELRILDIAEELSFLAVECEILGAPEIGTLFFETYQQITGDQIPGMLIQFFKSKRACYKAKFTIWHIREAQYCNDPKWVARTHDYLILAEKYANLACDKTA